MWIDRQTDRHADMTKLIVTFHNMQTCLKNQRGTKFFYTTVIPSGEDNWKMYNA